PDNRQEFAAHVVDGVRARGRCAGSEGAVLFSAPANCWTAPSGRRHGVMASARKCGPGADGVFPAPVGGRRAVVVGGGWWGWGEGGGKGRTFARVYLVLVRRVPGREAARELRWAFRVQGVRFRRRK